MALRGADEVRRRLRQARFAVREAFEAELKDIAQDLLKESRDRAPQLTGKMIATAGVGFDATRNVIRASVFYKEEYALYQHEGYYFPGPVSAPKLRSGRKGAGRKFLEAPFRKNVMLYQERLARAGNRALRIVAR